MSLCQLRSRSSCHEKIIAEHIVDVASELRLVDAAELMFMIRNNQQANISDLVNSSSELYFTPGTLKYGLASGCEVNWESSPLVALDMEFDHRAISAFFRLMLGRDHAGVEIIKIIFDEPNLSLATEMSRLSDAIVDAKLRGGSAKSMRALPASEATASRKSGEAR